MNIENPWNETRKAVQRSRYLLEAVDSIAQSMASLLVGRLRRVSPHTLVALKRELKDFDAHRKAWR